MKSVKEHNARDAGIGEARLLERATPPLGYRIVEAERRGQKIKKRLDIDPVEAEL